MQEIQALKAKKRISNNSKLLSLNPFLDDTGLLRIGGRLTNADLNWEQKHPLVIPNNHFVTGLIVKHFHEKTLHGGTQLVLNSIRQKYWLINANNTIKYHLRKCIKCFRTNPRTCRQIMSSLPAQRVRISLPFEHAGVDYAGPIDIKTSKLRNSRTTKAYICIFVCMATKAIHIELVTELSAEGFMAALRRFLSRRGACCHLYSDCGTNFAKANKLINESDHNNFTNGMPIKWHFNCPGAPNWGGLWEAGVKSVKTHMKRILQNTKLTYEELSTLLCQIEASVNSRPLTKLSNDPQDHNLLTPGHFLTGRNIITAVSKQHLDSTIPLKRWQHIQLLMNQFWKKWSSEYLHTLQERSKWKTGDINIELDEIVVMKDEQTAPTKWPLGRIIEIYKGEDGKVRSAKVRTQYGTYSRPITKICKLPL